MNVILFFADAQKLSKPQDRSFGVKYIQQHSSVWYLNKAILSIALRKSSGPHSYSYDHESIHVARNRGLSVVHFCSE